MKRFITKTIKYEYIILFTALSSGNYGQDGTYDAPAKFEIYLFRLV